MKDYQVIIEDFKTELKKAELSDETGVYFVFSATFDRSEGKISYYNIHKLLYIGRSNDVQKRISGKHHKHAAIVSSCEKIAGAIPVYYYGQVLRMTGASCDNDDLVRVESALIYSKDPPLNETADKAFHHPLTKISLLRSPNTCNVDDDGEFKPFPDAFNGSYVEVEDVTKSCTEDTVKG